MLSPRTNIGLYTITFKLVLKKKLLHLFEMTGKNTHISHRPEGVFEPPTQFFICMLSPWTNIDLQTITFKLVVKTKLLHQLEMTECLGPPLISSKASKV